MRRGKKLKEKKNSRSEKTKKKKDRCNMFKATEYAPWGICSKHMLELQSYGTFIHCIAK